MGTKERMDDDATFAGDLLGRLPTVPVAATLETRILADFDRIASRRGVWLVRWADSLWPGVPVWQPASLLALSLMIGLAAGALLPSSSVNTGSDQTLAAMDVVPSVDQYKDL